jgi:hypothetical protein
MRIQHYFPTALAVALAATAAQAQPAPAPKLIRAASTDAGGVNKLDRPTAPAWVEIAADPILTTLQAPGVSKWIQVDDGCDLRPVGDGKTAVFAAATTGRYRLVVIPADGEPLRVAVTVGIVPPVPPTPVPVPPTPVPPPAPPTSELGKKLQAAFDADAMPKADKLKLVALKAELYRQAATLAAKEAITTTKEFLDQVKAAATALGVDGLPAMRVVIATEITAVLPTESSMTPALRVAAAAVFQAISAALKEVK